MAQLTEEQLRKLIKEGLLLGSGDSTVKKNEHPFDPESEYGKSYTQGQYLGGTEITPILETAISGLMDQPPTKVYTSPPPPLRTGGEHPRTTTGGANSPNVHGVYRPYYGEVHQWDEGMFGTNEFKNTLIHELKHAGIQYMQDHPHLLPYIIYQMQTDEGQFGVALRDLVQNEEEMHKVINATSPRWLDKRDEDFGDFDPDRDKGQSDRDKYAEIMRIFNETTAKERATQEQKSATSSMKKKLKKKKRKK